MLKKLTLIVPVVILLLAMKTDKEAFKVYRNGGKSAEYSDMLKDAREAQVVFFGEMHDNSICHWLEFEFTKDLFSLDSNLILGAEMFETDNQLILNEYLAGEMSTKVFESEARLWKNYKTDYKPLVEFAKEKRLPFIATNIPRRYAALVNKEGFEGLDSLTADAKKYIAPLPVKYDPELKGYKSMLDMGEGSKEHASDNLPKAQAIKDATMAWCISENMADGSIFIHYNGAYHSENYEGIIWYLKLLRPDVKILTITTVEQDNMEELAEESRNLADYIILTPSSITRTY
jgi:uncharacterized iron-regulated protein